MFRYGSGKMGVMLAAAMLLLSTGCEKDEGRPPCSDRNELKNLYFGDLHAHTALSFDAYGYEVRTTPAEAFAFAKGEPILLPPLDESGAGTRTAAIDRPLDFAAITDHAEFYAEVRMCTTPGSPGYDSVPCTGFREGGENNVKIFGIKLAAYDPARFEAICGADGSDCAPFIDEVWDEAVAAAGEAYDTTTACTFTSFAGYEYTATPGVTNLHRNVIFGGEKLPDAPVSYFEEKTALGLWRAIDEQCVSKKGCDAIVIPHNSNWSNGQMFTPGYPEGSTSEEQAEIAELRARMEPAAEFHQHKGDLECKNGFEGLMDQDDPLCGFEKIREADFTDCGDGTGIGGANHYGCLSRLDYMRNVLKEGLAEEARIGVNPYKLAVIGSTDTHNGTPGNVAEKGFPGHVGTVDDTPAKRVGEGTMTHKPARYNPGGLAAVWAKENTREALFEAIRARETYSTSGPRIEVRFFGGWEYGAGLCDSSRLVSEGYEKGVPMGGELPAANGAAAPVFVLRAVADEGTAERPGTLLQAAQIIKGWMGPDGVAREKVFDVAGDRDNGASVDVTTCQQSGDGFSTLCAVWTDPEFDPAVPSFYYARVVENPSCRWSAYDCNELYAGDAGVPDGGCGWEEAPLAIQERAFTSPIWYAGQ